MSKPSRTDIFNKYNGHCGYCGEKLTKFQVDHIIPKRSFKEDIQDKVRVPKFLSHLTENDLGHIDNLIPTCQSCNNYKSGGSLEFFRFMIQDIPRKLKYQSIYKIGQRYGYTVNEDLKVVFYFESKLIEFKPEERTMALFVTAKRHLSKEEIIKLGKSLTEYGEELL